MRKQFAKSIPVMCLAAACCLLAVSFAGCGGGAIPPLRAHARQLLDGRDAVQDALDAIEKDLADAQSKMTSPEAMRGDAARAMLEAIARDRPYIVLCATADLEEHVIEAVPPSPRYAQGQSILSRTNFNPRSISGEAAMGVAFQNPDAPDQLACDIAYPLGKPTGEVIGSIRVRIAITRFLGDLLEPVVRSTPQNSFWVIQTEGLTLYSTNKIEVGKNVFTDMLYTPFEPLRDTAKRIINAPNGAGQYEFLGAGVDKPTRKFCNWESVREFGAQWRIVLVREDQ